MKKNTIVLLAVLLVVCVALGITQALAVTTDPTEQTTVPTLETVDISERPTVDIDIPTPDEMPDPPESDFQIPPGERPEPSTEFGERR